VITTQSVIRHNPKTIQQPNICQTQAVNAVTIPVNLHPSQLLQDQTSLSLATSHPVKHAYSHVLFHLTIISQLPIGDLRYKPTPPTRSAYLRKRSSVGYKLKFTVTTQYIPPYSHTPKPERNQRYEQQ
jgi:hypothetical protein